MALLARALLTAVLAPPIFLWIGEGVFEPRLDPVPAGLATLAIVMVALPALLALPRILPRVVLLNGCGAAVGLAFATIGFGLFGDTGEYTRSEKIGDSLVFAIEVLALGLLIAAATAGIVAAAQGLREPAAHES